MQYCHAVLDRPVSQYTVVCSIVLVVLGFCLFFFGAAYAPMHHDRVSYGPLEYLVGPLMLCAFLFFLGLKPSTLSSGSASLIWAGDDEDAHQRRVQVFRVIGVAVFGLGGLFLGLSVAFFRWFDTVPPTPNNCTTTAPLPTNGTISGPISMVPAYALLMEVGAIAVGIMLAWLSVVFQEQEELVRRDGGGGSSDGL